MSSLGRPVGEVVLILFVGEFVGEYAGDTEVNEDDDVGTIVSRVLSFPVGGDVLDFVGEVDRGNVVTTSIDSGLEGLLVGVFVVVAEPTEDDDEDDDDEDFGDIFRDTITAVKMEAPIITKIKNVII